MCDTRSRAMHGFCESDCGATHAVVPPRGRACRRLIQDIDCRYQLYLYDRIGSTLVAFSCAATGLVATLGRSNPRADAPSAPVAESPDRPWQRPSTSSALHL